jgi:hypothetical protein
MAWVIALLANKVAQVLPFTLDSAQFGRLDFDALG